MKKYHNLNKKLKYYKENVVQSKEWFEKNFQKISEIFENKTLRDFIFEPFIDVFNIPDKTIDKDIYTVITQVAIINAVLAGLPGQLGVGVYVSMAFEAWMAYVIAKHVGLEIKNPKDIYKYFGILSGTGFTIAFLFKHIISLFYSAFSVIPIINPLILAEIFTTNLVGVLFWVGFEEVKNHGNFKIPKRMFKLIIIKTKNIFSHQLKILKNTLTINNLKIAGLRLKQWLNGDIVDIRKINGELFAAVAMGYLLSRHYEKLRGPLGNIFEEAIRLRWSSQFDDNTSLEEIAERFKEYDEEQLQGAINTIKGKMFEILVEKAENADNDNIFAKMYEDESFPGSDIIFTNNETGEQLAVSLKAVAHENHEILESALVKYPNYPILATKEVSELYENNPEYFGKIFGSDISNEALKNITERNINELIENIEPIGESKVIVSGVAVSTIAVIWAFAMAYYRKKISYEQFQNALTKILADNGAKMAARLSYGFIFGPLFAWYLLARSVKKLTKV